MDINDTNTTRYYVHDGAESQPARWQSLAAQRADFGPEKWVAHVGAFLREHAASLGSPAVSKRRTEIYQQLSSSPDLDQLEQDVAELVDVAEAGRVKLSQIETDFAGRLPSLLPGR